MLNKNKAGFALGAFLGLWHLVWSALIYFGWAQPLLDFVYNLHSIMNPLIITDFDLGRSAGLVIVTALVGYVAGFVFASIWNKVSR